MKALKYFYNEKQLRLMDSPLPPEPSPKSVTIQVAYSGICGSDLHLLHGLFDVEGSPDFIMGHELSGTVCAVGRDVRRCAVGDKVVVDPMPWCGECRFCIRGQRNYCISGTHHRAVGLYSDGGWANYVQVPMEQVCKLQEGTALKQAALCEPMACVDHGFEVLGCIPDDAEILVIGAGIIGLLWASLLHYRGYRHVTICEIQEPRRKIAQQMQLGFKALHPTEISARFSDGSLLPENDGYNIIVDCSGNPKSIETAFKWLRNGGKLAIFGCCPKGSEMKINPADIFAKELSIVGIQTTRFNFPRTTHIVENMAEQYLSFDKLGIKEFSLEQHEEALAALRAGQISKAVFKIAD